MKQLIITTFIFLLLQLYSPSRVVVSLISQNTGENDADQEQGAQHQQQPSGDDVADAAVDVDNKTTTSEADIPDVLVLICTQSFTGEELVDDILVDRLLQVKAGWNIKVKLVDEAGIDWTEEDVQQEAAAALNLLNYGRAVIVVASTYADGDPPNHATEFADWLERKIASGSGDGDTVVSVPPFAVYGLGDSSYTHFASFGKYVDAALADRGGQRLLTVQVGDALDDLSGSFRLWCDEVADKLAKVLPFRVESEEYQRRPFTSTGADWRRSAISPGSVAVNVTGIKPLLQEDASRSVVHVDITVPLSISFHDLQPGDQVGIYPRNSDELIERTLEWLGVDADMPTRIVERQGDVWVETNITAYELLAAHVDLAGRTSPSALRAILPFAGTLELRALARDLTFVETKASSHETSTDSSTLSHFDAWIGGRRLTKLDLAILFECRPSLQAFARAIGPMQPRLYSVATVSKSTKEQTIGLCISVAEGGLCSNYVANLNIEHESSVTVFFRKSQFHFIPDGSPSLLIAAGSGIGPYVGFLENELQRMETMGVSSPLSRVHLSFGCRSPSEILYKDRLSAFEELGSNVHYAFSRLFGQPKLHAQDIIKKEMASVWKDVFEDEGRVFVCGRMEICTGVKDALLEVAREIGGQQENEARQTIQRMEKEGKLLTDCWSVDEASPLPRNHTFSSVPRVVPRLERHHGVGSATCQSSQSESVDLSTVPAWPSYLRLAASGELERRIQNATNMFSACVACGRFCEVDRLSEDSADWGECRVGEKAIVSAVDAHFGEEPCLKGTHGSGTIFFGACNLKCMYCQNWKIAHMDRGEVVDHFQLAEYMLELQNRGCHNINLVSPTHNVLAILRAILVAAQNGLKLPIVFNTGGYDSVASLRLFEDVIDIYMPDSKYASRKVARKLSRIDNYPEINQAAIKEMHRQVGDLKIDPRTGLAWRGLLVRHLILPSDNAGTEAVADFLANEISIDTYMHLMDYYRPEHEARDDKKFGLNKKPSKEELEAAHKDARDSCLHRLLGDEQYPNEMSSYASCEDSGRQNNNYQSSHETPDGLIKVAISS